MCKAPQRPAQAGTALPNLRGGARRRGERATQTPQADSDAPNGWQAVTPSVGTQETARRASRAAVTDAPEMCLCVSCGGRFPVDALSESAAARLVRHYRNEIHKRQDRYVAAAIEISFERHRLARALRLLWPRIVTMAQSSRRPALARELERFAAMFLINED